MFDIGLQEMLLIGVLALLVFGPSKLPELGRMFGRAMREFRRASDEFRSTVETNLHINDTDPIIAPPTPSPAPSASVAEPTVLPSEQEPVGAFEDTGTVPAEEHGEPFCARRGARLFHRRQCAWVARIPEPDRVYFKQLAEAREEGLLTCPACEPWESSASS
jgi:TatA/E family protein of Tat protein translocase